MFSQPYLPQGHSFCSSYQFPSPFPFLKISICVFCFVLTPGPLVTVGPFNVHVNDLSSILASTQSTSTTCGRTPWTAPSSGLRTSLFPSSCFSCLPLPSSGSCQHMAIAASPFASSILTLSCLSPVMHDPFFISVAGTINPVVSFPPSHPLWEKPSALCGCSIHPGSRRCWRESPKSDLILSPSRALGTGTVLPSVPAQPPWLSPWQLPSISHFRIKSKHPNLVFEALYDVIVTSSFTALTLFL